MAFQKGFQVELRQDPDHLPPALVRSQHILSRKKKGLAMAQRNRIINP